MMSYLIQMFVISISIAPAFSAFNFPNAVQTGMTEMEKQKLLADCKQDFKKLLWLNIQFPLTPDQVQLMKTIQANTDKLNNKDLWGSFDTQTRVSLMNAGNDAKVDCTNLKNKMGELKQKLNVQTELNSITVQIKTQSLGEKIFNDMTLFDSWVNSLNTLKNKVNNFAQFSTSVTNLAANRLQVWNINLAKLLVKDCIYDLPQLFNIIQFPMPPDETQINFVIQEFQTNTAKLNNEDIWRAIDSEGRDFLKDAKSFTQTNCMNLNNRIDGDIKYQFQLGAMISTTKNPSNGKNIYSKIDPAARMPEPEVFTMPDPSTYINQQPSIDPKAVVHFIQHINRVTDLAFERLAFWEKAKFYLKK